MKAALYHEFAKPLILESVPDPSPSQGGVVIKVMATGLCRSDWHGWMGHDPDITLPHVPGHELAGIVEAVDKGVKHWKAGDRVTLPFVGGCGTCPQCSSGNHQVCDHQFQPGFTHWGSFAQYVAINHADINLVRLLEGMSFVTAASLGCRFATSFRAVVHQGQVREGQWVAVHGCGGVGLSAIMIAQAFGARVVAVDINEYKLAFARSIGADVCVNAASSSDIVKDIMSITHGGCHISLDALGSSATCFNSIACLRKRGRHIQVGLMLAGDSRPQVPMSQVVANELQVFGSHGMQAHKYPEMLAMIASGRLKPDSLIGKTITLEQSLQALTQMNSFAGTGVTVINAF